MQKCVKATLLITAVREKNNNNKNMGNKMQKWGGRIEM